MPATIPYIVSIYPLPVSHRMPNLNGQPDFFIKAASPDSPRVLAIDETTESVHIDGQAYTFKQNVSGIEIRDALVSLWNRNRITERQPDARVGIFAYNASELPAEDKLKKSTVYKAAVEAQERYWVAAINEAIGFYDKGQRSRIKNDVHRLAARMRNVVEQHAWAGELRAEAHKICPACATSIHSAAYVCSSCGHIVDIQKATQVKIEHIKFERQAWIDAGLDPADMPPVTMPVAGGRVAGKGKPQVAAPQAPAAPAITDVSDVANANLGNQIDAFEAEVAAIAEGRA